MLNFPHNPTGTLASKEFFVEVVKLARKYNDYNYDSATYESALDGFTGGTITVNPPAPYVTNVVEDDIYIARIRGENVFVVIKVTKLKFTTDDDLDKIVFSYKK